METASITQHKGKREKAAEPDNVIACDGHWHMEVQDFFHDMPKVREKFLELSIRKVISKNEVIFFEEEISPACYYLEEGVVKIFKISLSGKELIIFMRHQGEMFGLAEIVDSKKRKCNAQTLTDCVLHVLPKRDFEALVKSSPEFALKVVSTMGTRIRYLGDQVESLMVCDVSTRLAKLLLYLVFNQLKDPESWKQAVEIEKILTQEQMAAMTGSCQQTISSTLKAFQEEGLIEVKRRRICLLNPLAVLDKTGS
jgi:CRP-like cAMP-binding protein